VNECNSSPCKNGATCKDSTVNTTLVSAHAYQCVCSVGFANGMCGYTFMAQYAKRCAVPESTSDSVHRARRVRTGPVQRSAHDGMCWVCSGVYDRRRDVPCVCSGLVRERHRHDCGVLCL
jgi:hypothetical protein